MQLGTVIGNVWATRKNEQLSGCKLMVVAPYTYPGFTPASPLVAVDSIGAGIGEMVLVVGGSSARISVGQGNQPIDHVIVGIIDRVELDDALLPSVAALASVAQAL